MLRTLFVIMAGLLAVAPICGPNMTVTFTYSNQDAETVSFSTRMGTTGDWLESGISVPADSSVTTNPFRVEKNYWFSCVVKDPQNATLDSIVIAGYEWHGTSAVAWYWDGTTLTPFVHIPDGGAFH